MSIRLNVVLSQASQSSSQRSDLESELAARLMGVAGIDLSLIGPLESLTESSTDRLMLERLSGDLALLSWEEPAVAADRLRAAAVHGRRAPHRLDPAAPAQPPATRAAVAPSESAPPGSDSPGERRIYCVPMADQTLAGLQQAIGQLLAERRVVTFQLGSVGAPSVAGPRPAEPRQSLPTVPASSAAAAAAAASSPASPPSPPAAPAAAIASDVSHTSAPAAPGSAVSQPKPLPLRHGASEGRSNAQRDGLDALVDELNDSDI